MLTRGYGGPSRYVQGPGVLADLGIYAAGLGSKALLLVDGVIEKIYGEALRASLAKSGVECVSTVFGGESTAEEVARCAELGRGMSVVIGVGGGKTLDVGKVAAREVDARTITVPTIASTDSPTSAIGVIYTADGIYDHVEFCGRNPDVVLVDSEVISRAPVRFLAAGMGDALATWFEARSNFESRSKNYISDGYAPTIAGAQIARACYDTLMRDGRAAYLAAKAGCLTEAVENIIEANTLLSGLGFENCGVSAAHGIHDALTVLEPTHQFFHGEKVAFGIIALLVLENRDPQEISETICFCADVGLPVRLAELGLGDITDADLLQVGEAAMNPTSVIHAVPRTLTARIVADAIRTADVLASQTLERRSFPHR